MSALSEKDMHKCLDPSTEMSAIHFYLVMACNETVKLYADDLAAVNFRYRNDKVDGSAFIFSHTQERDLNVYVTRRHAFLEISVPLAIYSQQGMFKGRKLMADNCFYESSEKGRVICNVLYIVGGLH